MRHGPFGVLETLELAQPFVLDFRGEERSHCVCSVGWPAAAKNGDTINGPLLEPLQNRGSENQGTGPTPLALNGQFRRVREATCQGNGIWLLLIQDGQV